jgi:hypothetical protein
MIPRQRYRWAFGGGSTVWTLTYNGSWNAWLQETVKRFFAT